MKKFNFDKENYPVVRKIKYKCKNCENLLIEIKIEKKIKIYSKNNFNYFFAFRNEIIFNKKIILITNIEKIQHLKGDDQFCLYLNIKCESCKKNIGRIYKTGNSKIDPFLDDILLDINFVNKNDVSNNLKNQKFEEKQEKKSIFDIKVSPRNLLLNNKILNDLELLKKKKCHS